MTERTYSLPACRRLLFPLLHAEKGRPRATKEIGDVCTQANIFGVRTCKLVEGRVSNIL